MSSAIPQLFNNASQTVLSGTEGFDQLKDQALNQALQGEISSYTPVKNQSGLGDLSQGLGVLGQIGQLGMTGGALGAGFSQGFNAPPCWVAYELYAPDTARIIRSYILNWAKRSIFGRAFLDTYLQCGERLAKRIKHDKIARRVCRFVFDKLLLKALAEQV